MQGTIGFEKYRIRCIIGVEPFEREKEQEILVDLKVDYNFKKASETDILSHTIDYTELASICMKIAVSGRYFLLEKYAVDVLLEIKRKFLVNKATITVRKPNALLNAENCFVQVSI